jgi:YVTN family beta-propeller protein
VVDTASNTVVATAPVGVNPRGLDTIPYGAFVYVANSGSDTVSVIDTASNTVQATVAVGISPFGVVSIARLAPFVSRALNNTVGAAVAVMHSIPSADVELH